MFSQAKQAHVLITFTKYIKLRDVVNIVVLQDMIIVYAGENMAHMHYTVPMVTTQICKSETHPVIICSSEVVFQRSNIPAKYYSSEVLFQRSQQSRIRAQS